MFEDLPPPPDFEFDPVAFMKIHLLACEYCAGTGLEDPSGFIAFAETRLTADEVRNWQPQLIYKAGQVEREIRAHLAEREATRRKMH